ncbi:MAG: DUF362 domain-containing protein [Acidobacteria bacterium]|jgi:hypothetical protein|nr:DUF362 domain-containing protein [Acidobacteriota bacterium]
MKENVYLIPVTDNEPDIEVCRKLEGFLASGDFFSFIQPRDMVAFKTHFGEEGTQGFVRPLHFKMMGALARQRGGLPFLTDTATLYTGMRNQAVSHIELAQRHGFGYENTGLPLIMADGLTGDEELAVEIPGRIYRSVKLASMIVKAQALVVVSHFTGHVASGFGAALKNMGMGCASRRGKMEQHSTAKPAVKKKKCTACGACLKWCPARAITMTEGAARIEKALCIGCGECLTACRFDAIGYNWSATYEQLQSKIVEHAWGVAACKGGKALYVNFLTRVSKDCDCMSGYRKIVPDIGVLVSRDPVALDAASLDLVEQRAGQPLTALSYDIPHRVQIEYAREIGFGNPDYQLLEKP